MCVCVWEVELFFFKKKIVEAYKQRSLAGALKIPLLLPPIAMSEWDGRIWLALLCLIYILF